MHSNLTQPILPLRLFWHYSDLNNPSLQRSSNIFFVNCKLSDHFCRYQYEDQQQIYNIVDHYGQDILLMPQSDNDANHVQMSSSQDQLAPMQYEQVIVEQSADAEMQEVYLNQVTIYTVKLALKYAFISCHKLRNE